MQNIDEILKSHKLSQQEYQDIKDILKREPNLLEIGIFSAMWSEHCSYKSSKFYLNGFPTTAPWVIQGPGENAGVIDIGENLAAVFKMESHNHPSFIEPYQGAATGVGGILRDIFTMGARPVANLNALRFGNIKNNDKISSHQRYLVKGVVAGIGDYGNCMGVPTIGGETSFDESFNGNILVNAFTLGIAKKDEIFYGRAEGIGNPVIYVGSKTGRDGLGGAVMASDSFSEENNALRPTVQVGDPFSEKLLLEACLELFKQDYIVGIQDMGAAGLTSSSFEMAGRSGSGMIMHLDKVPMREPKMSPYELMLSESQERMLICAKKGYEEKVLEIFEKWDLNAKVIGEVTNTGEMELFWHNEKVANIPIEPLSEKAPILNRPTKKPEYLAKMQKPNIKNYKQIPNQEAFLTLLQHEEIAHKAWIYEQYDSSVQTNTIKSSRHLGSGVIRIKNTSLSVAMSAKCDPRVNYIDPLKGAALAVLQSAKEVALSGAEPKAITDCLNYGNPENPEVMWQFAQGCEGIKQACKALNTPVVSGNVSLYNETDGISVYPTPAIVTVGVGDDKPLYSSLTKEGNSLYLIGKFSPNFSASLYLKALFDENNGVLDEIDYELELKLWNFLLKHKHSLIKSAKNISKGGIAMSLAKMAAISEFGIKAEFKLDDSREIFARLEHCFIAECENEKELENALKQENLSFIRLGIITKDEFVLNDIHIKLDELKSLYFNSFANLIEKDL